jgi:hypothetical protein
VAATDIDPPLSIHVIATVDMPARVTFPRHLAAESSGHARGVHRTFSRVLGMSLLPRTKGPLGRRNALRVGSTSFGPPDQRIGRAARHG